MPCTKSRRSLFGLFGSVGTLGLGIGIVAGCSSPGFSSGPSESAPTSVASSTTTSRPSSGTSSSSESAARSGGAVKLAAPGTVRNWNDVRRQAAQRIMAANPTLVYSGAVPDPLLAIPVLEVELNGDGSIRRIEVLRHPRQAKDTTQIAIQAVHNAAPFGDVSRLPKPWRFTETFLFDEDRKFKPRSLD